MRAALWVVDPFTPPAMRTALLLNRVEVWPCTAAAIAAVAVHVLVPLNSSAVLCELVPFEPPATRTCPLATMLDGRNVDVWACRADVIVPADDQVPFSGARIEEKRRGQRGR